MSVVDLRLDPGCVNWWFGEHAERAELKGWIRLDDGNASWTHGTCCSPVTPCARDDAGGSSVGAHVAIDVLRSSHTARRVATCAPVVLGDR